MSPLERVAEEERDLLIANTEEEELNSQDATGDKSGAIFSEPMRYEKIVVHAHPRKDKDPGIVAKLLSYFEMPATAGHGGASSQASSHFFYFNVLNANRPQSHNQTYNSPGLRQRPFSSSMPHGDDELRCRCYPSMRSVLLCVLSSLIILSSLMFLLKLLELISEQQRIQASDWNETHYIEQFKSTPRANTGDWIVSNSKCHIPELDPWHASIRDMVETKPPMNCTEIARNNGFVGASLTYVESNRLHFTPEAQRDESPRHCCYREIRRGGDNDDDLENDEKCINVTSVEVDSATRGYKIPVPLMRLECKSLNYTNVHSFIVHNVEEEEALKKVASEKLDPDDYYNIVMVGVDTISRLNAIRQLNSTLSYLKSHYKTIEYFGYNKVGENTFPNLVPLLTGLRPEQLNEVMCWAATNYTDESEKADDYLDNCKFLWNFYQQAGYVTYFSEDWPKASTFNYLKPGFKSAPSNFYGRPFTIARDDLLLPPVSMGCSSCLLDRCLVDVDLNNLKSFIHEYKDTPHFAFHWINCPQHDDLNGASQVDAVIEKFFQDLLNYTYSSRTFVFFFSDHGYRWNNFVSTRIGHFESSLPLLTIAPPRRFIERHRAEYEALKSHTSSLITPFDLFKTLIHIRNIGYKANMRSRVSRAAVPSARGTHPLNVNEEETPEPTATTSTSQVRMIDGTSYRQEFTSLSLLDQHNASTLDRSCIEAGIPDNYCICNQFTEISTTSLDVVGAAYYLVYAHMDRRIQRRNDICHLLDLSNIYKAEYYDFEKMKYKKTRRRRQAKAPNNRATGARTTARPTEVTTTTISPADTTEASAATGKLPNREYNVLISTSPGAGLFQEVVRYYGDDIESCIAAIRVAKKTIDNRKSPYESKYQAVMRMNQKCRFSVHSDSISRLNLYKDQSKCVKNDIELKKICYCNDLLH